MTLATGTWRNPALTAWDLSTDGKRPMSPREERTGTMGRTHHVEVRWTWYVELTL